MNAPTVGVAHVVLYTDRMTESAQFMRTVGMVPVFDGSQVSVFELRGGTHLLLTRARRRIRPKTEAPFDLMVDDIDAAREDCRRAGLRPSRPGRSHVHRSFTISGPDGYVITITSSHAGRRAV